MMERSDHQTYHYGECGLSYVHLENISMFHCKPCGAEMPLIPRITELHDLIAEIVARRPQKLIPPEIRFLRTHLGLSQKEYAESIGVTPESWNRWENGKDKFQLYNEKLLRYTVLACVESRRLDPATCRTIATKSERDAEKPVLVSNGTQDGDERWLTELDPWR